ncbi:triosephosphate isomerase [Striga asiatica]|uniref:Triosephosphate isomerase n=1 Tax=Striga asiatica TaxID=4170 RepID=A0A5A7P0M0_STRAF|nr:triosephosphate isomerase [Striga asiatica]
MARKFFVGGNWKCNGTSEEIKKIVSTLNAAEVPSEDGLVAFAARRNFCSRRGRRSSEIGAEQRRRSQRGGESRAARRASGVAAARWFSGEGDDSATMKAYHVQDRGGRECDDVVTTRKEDDSGEFKRDMKVMRSKLDLRRRKNMLMEGFSDQMRCFT